MECLLLYITLYLLHDSYSQFYKVCYILQWKIDLLENYYLIWFPISWVCRHFLTSPRVATASFLSTINNVSQTYYMSSINNASQKIFLWPLINNKFSNLVKISKCFAFFVFGVNQENAGENVLQKKLFLKILQCSQENTCFEVCFNKGADF